MRLFVFPKVWSALPGREPALPSLFPSEAPWNSVIVYLLFLTSGVSTLVFWPEVSGIRAACFNFSLFKMGETTHGLRAAHRQTLGWTSPASWTTPLPASHPPFTWSYFNLWTPASTSEILPGTYFTWTLQHLHHRPLPRSNLLPLGF